MLYLGQANQWREMARWQRMTSRSNWTRSSDRPRLRVPTRLWVRSRVLRRWFFCQAASLCGMTHQSQQATTLGLLLGQGPMEAVRLRPVYLQPIQQAPVGGLWTFRRALYKGCVTCGARVPSRLIQGLVYQFVPRLSEALGWPRSYESLTRWSP